MKDKPIKILGLSFYYHDSAAALVVDGVPLAMSEEERFSRRKHDSGYPHGAVKFVLESTGTKIEELDYVVFYEKPFKKFERLLKTLLATWPEAPLVFTEVIKSWFIDKFWIRNLISENLKVPAHEILFSEHHLSHLASAFLCSPYEKAAVLSIDGIGEWATVALGVGEGRQIKIIKEINFPHSLGLLYSTFTAFLGFEVNDGEYKVMGMAPYGEPRYKDKIRRLINSFPDGSFELKLEYFDFYRSSHRSYSDKFISLFGHPRDPQSKFFTRNSGWPSYFGDRPDNWEELAKEQEYYADVAASLQEVTEEIITGLASALRKETGLDRLCYAGGVALNSVANRKLVQNAGFKEVFIQPAAGDAGGALGAALYVYHAVLDRPRNYVMKQAAYGAGFSNGEIKKFLEGNKISYEFLVDEEELLNRSARWLSEGKVLGWFSGRVEWGPRALGSRSILADPRKAEMKNIVNVKIKFREPYRPFAPSVLSERAEEYFEIGNVTASYPARFMLYVVPVRKDKQKEVPAITHVDGTARPQLVFPDTNSRYWKLIKGFEKITGVPMLLNTSFNLKGEPIVNSPADAYKTFMASGLDILVLENFVVRKKSATDGQD